MRQCPATTVRTAASTSQATDASPQLWLDLHRGTLATVAGVIAVIALGLGVLGRGRD